MKVKCVLCDRLEELNEDTSMAKRLKNRPIHTYMCEECTKRIADRTCERIATGNFKFYRSSSKIEKDF
ncbi:YlaI family protein [Chungangia koreensis]|uniref:YlaI family protein n=1 Tax=Chungangia koreensis TaxID=752657 RepID=A0ABV8X3Y8_9LACT